MNIMISLSTFFIDGVSTSSISLSNELHRRGHNVFFHAESDRDMSARGRLNPDIPVFISNEERKIFSYIEENNIQVVHTQVPSTHKKISSIVKLNPGIVHIATTHGNYNVFGETKTKMMLKDTDEGVDVWTGVASKNIDILKKCGVPDDKIILIPNGVPDMTPDEIEIPELMKEDLMSDSKPFIFTVASRPTESKGWEYAAQIAKKLHNNGFNIKMYFIGGGTSYYELIKKRFINDKYIVFCGYQDKPVNYLRHSDVSMMLTFFVGESAPMSILESMSVGTPFIGTDVADIKKMITTKSGKLAGAVSSTFIRPIEFEEIYELCKKAITDKEWYAEIKANAQDKISEVSIKQTAHEYELLYTDFINKKFIYEVF